VSFSWEEAQNIAVHIKIVPVHPGGRPWTLVFCAFPALPGPSCKHQPSSLGRRVKSYRRR